MLQNGGSLYLLQNLSCCPLLRKLHIVHFKEVLKQILLFTTLKVHLELKGNELITDTADRLNKNGDNLEITTP